jgi:hypothetical protein
MVAAFQASEETLSPGLNLVSTLDAPALSLLRGPAESTTRPPARKPSPDLTAPSATPDEVLIAGLPFAALRLRSPLRLEVQREDDQVAVWSPDLEEMGFGPHLGAAIEDFQQTIVELYAALEDEAAADRLGPGMVDLWQRLQDVVERRG